MSTEESKPGIPSTCKDLAKALRLNEAEATILMHITKAATVADNASDSFDSGRQDRIINLFDMIHIEICAGPTLRIIEAMNAALTQSPVQPPQETHNPHGDDQARTGDL